MAAKKEPEDFEVDSDGEPVKKKTPKKSSGKKSKKKKEKETSSEEEDQEEDDSSSEEEEKPKKKKSSGKKKKEKETIDQKEQEPLQNAEMRETMKEFYKYILDNGTDFPRVFLVAEGKTITCGTCSKVGHKRDGKVCPLHKYEISENSFLITMENKIRRMVKMGMFEE